MPNNPKKARCRRMWAFWFHSEKGKRFTVRATKRSCQISIDYNGTPDEKPIPGTFIPDECYEELVEKAAEALAQQDYELDPTHIKAPAEGYIPEAQAVLTAIGLSNGAKGKGRKG